MPTKVRLDREARQTAELQQRKELIDNMPAHIRKRVEARQFGGEGESRVVANILDSDPPYLKLKGGLLVFDSNGDFGILAKGDPTGSANDDRADSSRQEVKNLQQRYPDDWLKRSGAKRIALTEAALPPQERAIKPSKGRPGPISVRTVQDYFRKIRRANKVP